MPEIVESKQYELFCNEQMIKSEFRQMWANKKRHELAAKSWQGGPHKQSNKQTITNKNWLSEVVTN